MIRPPCGTCSFMIRNAPWVIRNAPVRLVSTTACQVSSGRLLDRGRRRASPGVVEQQVESPEEVVDRREQGVDGRLVRDVCGDHDSLRAGVPALGRGPLEGRCLPTGQHDREPRGGQRDRRRPADPRTGARDQRNPGRSCLSYPSLSSRRAAKGRGRGEPGRDRACTWTASNVDALGPSTAGLAMPVQAVANQREKGRPLIRRARGPIRPMLGTIIEPHGRPEDDRRHGTAPLAH